MSYRNLKIDYEKILTLLQYIFLLEFIWHIL